MSFFLALQEIFEISDRKIPFTVPERGGSIQISEARLSKDEIILLRK